MRFFRTVKDSVYNPDFYENLPARWSPSSSLKYFARLVFLISCILAIFPIIAGIVLLSNPDKIGSIRTQIVETFPQELVVNIKNGEVSTNVEEPYFIPQPAGIREELLRQMNRKLPYEANNLLVINTRKPIELTDFQNYRTLAILGKNEVGFYSPDRGRIDVQSLKDFSLPYALDRQSFGSLVDSGWNTLKTILVVLMILSPFLIFLALFIFYLLYLIFGALVVWLAAKISNLRFTYGESYQSGLHLITLPLILSFLLPFIFQLPFILTLTLFIMALINFKNTRDAIDTRGRREDSTIPGSKPNTPDRSRYA